MIKMNQILNQNYPPNSVSEKKRVTNAPRNIMDFADRVSHYALIFWPMPCCTVLITFLVFFC